MAFSVSDAGRFSALVSSDLLIDLERGGKSPPALSDFDERGAPKCVLKGDFWGPCSDAQRLRFHHLSLKGGTKSLEAWIRKIGSPRQGKLNEGFEHTRNRGHRLDDRLLGSLPNPENDRLPVVAAQHACLPGRNALVHGLSVAEINR
jgi:hypothetical protein